MSGLFFFFLMSGHILKAEPMDFLDDPGQNMREGATDNSKFGAAIAETGQSVGGTGLKRR